MKTPTVEHLDTHRASRRFRGRPLTSLVALILTALVVVAGCAPLPPAPTRDDQVEQLVAFVEAHRGHQFVTRPVVEFVPDAEFRQHVLDSLQAAEPELDVDEVAFKALGWMSPHDSLFDKYKIAFGNAVVGFYDPESKVLEVRGDELTPYRREVVVHELTHALDDQIFDLSPSKGPGVLSEEQLAYLVAVEGDAADIQRAFVASSSPLDQLGSLIEQLSFPLDPEILTVPVALLSISQTPYLRGPEFVEGLGGPSAVDQMFGRFPTTAEQAWDVRKYLADEPAEHVDSPPAAGDVVASGSWGQFFMSLILSNGINLNGSVDPVTDGWAGDSYVTWTTAGESCIRIDTRQDTPALADQLRAALDAWATTSGSQIQSLDSTTVRLTRCA
ncbi:MAG: hypothetical protein WBF71_07420 [Microthrixaceae bacterium]